ncbi:hypothetical protein [Streptomyces anandii]|uniref:hypothetical protein n=1 Tax=Streptomyces anandii TaxID=285454 RepID=UPI000B2E6231|nr:hypothetical protein [Streptomyces anandii]GGX94805.1 hypothetical protein GCM10010510_45130 [Streptomyces anandii JCM 4720]
MAQTAASKTTAAKASKPAPAATETPAAPVADDLSALLTPQRYEAGTSTVPQEVATFVENAFEAWQKDKNAWQIVTLSSPERVELIFKQARRYCFDRETKLTFQRRRTENTNELVYRVRDKIAAKRTKK